MDAQVDYLVTELRTSYQSVNRTLTHPGVNVDGASDDVLFRFERPAVVIDRPRGDPAVQQVIQTRRRYARQALSAGQTALSPRRITIPPVVIVAPAATLTHFAFDRADLTARHHTQLRQVAARIARSWQAGSPVHTVNLVGHTDPVGSVAYNRSLGQRRGLAARAALVRSLEEQQRGLGSRVLILVNSKGEQEAVNADPGSNRRVEVFLSTRRLRSPRPLSPPRPVPPVLDSEPPPSPPLTACDRVALERLVDRCIRDSRGCVEQAITSMTLALRRNPIDNIRAGAAFLLALRRCREALLECDRRAKQDTGCTR
jgi:outer membrane protein OmpA-like peptidoglycan-associated protein